MVESESHSNSGIHLNNHGTTSRVSDSSPERLDRVQGYAFGFDALSIQIFMTITLMIINIKLRRHKIEST